MHSLWDSFKVMSVVSLDVLSENRKGLTSQEFCSYLYAGFHVDVLAVSVSDRKFPQLPTVSVTFNICYDVP